MIFAVKTNHKQSVSYNVCNTSVPLWSLPNLSLKQLSTKPIGSTSSVNLDLSDLSDRAASVCGSVVEEDLTRAAGSA